MLSSSWQGLSKYAKVGKFAKKKTFNQWVEGSNPSGLNSYKISVTKFFIFLNSTHWLNSIIALVTCVANDNSCLKVTNLLKLKLS